MPFAASKLHIYSNIFFQGKSVVLHLFEEPVEGHSTEIDKEKKANSP